MLPSEENKSRGTTENSCFERLPLRSISCLERATITIRTNNPRPSFSSVTVSFDFDFARFHAVLNVLGSAFLIGAKKLTELDLILSVQNSSTLFFSILSCRFMSSLMLSSITDFVNNLTKSAPSFIGEGIREVVKRINYAFCVF